MTVRGWRSRYGMFAGGVLLLGGFTALNLTHGVPAEAIGVAATGPALWLARVFREVWRLFDGRSTAPRVLASTVLLIGLTIVEFGSLYNRQRGSFAGMTTRVAPLYFSITTFTTTGFGDIHPITSGAQLLVSAQMLLDWVESAVVVALVLAVLMDALNQYRTRRQAGPDGAGAPAAAVGDNPTAG
jgi:voltage-gated potassium channel